MPETEADAALCAHAFDVLLSNLDGKPAPTLSRGEVGGVFVTWNIRVDNADYELYDLRGCIGTLTPTNLGYAVGHYAEQAAFHDHRFDPITRRELSALQVGVSLLHTFEDAPDGVHDWQVGTHGIILNFDHNGSNYSATYLPEVADDQGWTQQEAVASLAQKAGFNGSLTQRILRGASLTRYQSSKYAMTYQDYLQYARAR